MVVAVLLVFASVVPAFSEGPDSDVFAPAGKVVFEPPAPRLVGFDRGLRALVGLASSGTIWRVDADGRSAPRAVETGLSSARAVAVDEARHRVFVVGDVPSTLQPAISVVHLDSMKASTPFTSTSYGVPVLTRATTLAYSPSEDRVYVARDSGMIQGEITTSVVLYAFDAAGLASGAADALVWSYPIPACAYMPPGDPLRPPFLGYSPAGRFLYFACSGGGTGMHGAVRLHLRPGTGAADTSNFQVEFFPFAGDFSFGFANGDPGGERLFFVVTAAGAKLYVFDARRAMWTGAVPLESDSSAGGSVDPVSGRIYILTLGRGVLVTEGSATRVPQGQEYRLEHTPTTAADFSHPVVDPDTRTLWVKVGDAWYAYRDKIPPPPRGREDDPDAATDSRAVEKPGATVSTFSGAARAFGSRRFFVAGLQGTSAYELAPPVVEMMPARSGQRELFLGQVLDANVNESGAGAKAVGTRFDENTAGDLDQAEPATEAARGAGADPGEAAGTAQSHCSAFSGDRVLDERPGSAVSCDSANQAVTALGESSLTAGEVRVGYASASVSIRRDPKRGTVARAEAVARDVVIPGLLRIGEVRSVVESVAHGVTGTARTSVTRTVDDVVITGPAGEVAFSCGYGTGPACRSPDAVAAAVNRLLQPRMRAAAPRFDSGPATFGSPGGAKAAFIKDPYQESNDVSTNQDRQMEVAALELDFYNDGKRSSRLVVQLAAVSTDANYTVNPLPNGEALAPVVSVASPPPRVLGIEIRRTSAPAVASPDGGLVRRVVRRIGHGLVFLLTNPREAALLAGFWSLVAIPFALGLRRRTLRAARRQG